MKLEQNRHLLEERQCTERDIADWLNLITEYMELKTLDRITVMELIESIKVGERKRDNGRREQEISIRYRFIGNLLDNAKEDIANCLNDALNGKTLSFRRINYMSQM